MILSPTANGGTLLQWGCQVQLLDAVTDAGLFGERKTLWDRNGLTLTRFITDEIRLYELSLSPRMQLNATVRERLPIHEDHLYQEFTEDGCLIKRYVYEAGETMVEGLMQRYVA